CAVLEVVYCPPRLGPQAQPAADQCGVRLQLVHYRRVHRIIVDAGVIDEVLARPALLDAPGCPVAATTTGQAHHDRPGRARSLPPARAHGLSAITVDTAPICVTARPAGVTSRSARRGTPAGRGA